MKHRIVFHWPSQIKLMGALICLMLVWLWPGQAATPPVDFRLPPTFPVGDGPWQVVAADLNKDGIADLATANFMNGTVSLLLGQGNARFAPAVHFSVGSGPNSLAAGDINNDSSLDLVTANAQGWSGAGSLSVLLGRGDGSFEPARQVTVGRGPRGVALADFNGDGRLDAATAITGGWFTTNQINVLFGLGDGTFAEPASYTVGRDPFSIAAGDFNGDGRPDLVTPNNGADTMGATVSVLINRGDGTFFGAANYTVGSYPSQVLALDLNHDNRLDLAVTDSYGVSPALSVLLGRGDGTFNAATTYPSPAGAARLASADFNRDTHPDLAVQGDSYGCGAITLFLGTGTGAFAPGSTSYIGAALQGVTSADLNQDANPDVAVTAGYNSSVLLMRGNGDGTFSDRMDAYPVGGSINGLITADFNRDNQLDVATASRENNSVSVLLQRTNGIFNAVTNYSVGSQPYAVKAGDFNNDGRLDLVTANFDGSLTLLRGRTTAPGAFARDWPALTIGSNHTDVAVGRFNADGNLDLVTLNYYGASLSVAFGNGDGTFLPGPSLSINSGPSCVLVEDLNADAFADIIVGYEGGSKVSILLGNGGGTFAPKADFNSFDIPVSVAVGDFNGDGKPDIVAANYDWRQVNVLLNQTAGGVLDFAAPVSHAIANDPINVAVGDFNGDNLLDIAAGAYSAVSILLGYGDGTFSTATNYWAGGARVAIADFNRDGMPDLALDLGSKVGVFWNDTIPRLQISPVGDDVRIAWPAWKGYQLQASSAILSSENWQTLSNIEPATVGSQYVLTNAPTGETQIYRLRRP